MKSFTGYYNLSHLRDGKSDSETKSFPDDRTSIKPMTLQSARLSQEFVDHVLAVCISWKPERWAIPEIPFFCKTTEESPFPRVKSRERVARLANRRNEAMSEAMLAYPDTRHVLMIDSYYLTQVSEIRTLLSEYAELSASGECIIGASTWFQDKTRVRSRIRFWDSWITPEAKALALPKEKKRGNRLLVRALGACYVFPREVWEIHPYGVPLEGGEHVPLCVGSGLPVWLSLDAQLWRDPVTYPWPKRIRQSLNLGRLRHGRGERSKIEHSFVIVMM